MTRSCSRCSVFFETRSPKALYHSEACKQAAYRERLATESRASVPELELLERIAVDRIRARELAPEEGLLAVVFPSRRLLDALQTAAA
jgi:hypothetical protein